MNGGLNFSDFGSSQSTKNKESNFRKAGEVFTFGDNNTINNSSVSSNSGKSSNYDSWLSYMNNQSSSQSSSSNSQSQSKPINGWTPKENTSSSTQSNTNTEPRETLAEIQEKKRLTDRTGKVYESQEAWDEMMAKSKAEQANKPSAGATIASQVRPEYAAQAEKFYNNVDAMNLSEEAKGRVLSQMGGDMFLPDPKKQMVKLQNSIGHLPAKHQANVMQWFSGEGFGR